MSLELLPARTAMAINLTQPFSGIGGTEPYAYSLISGAGTIDPITGLYTSPAVVPAPSADPIVVQVQDTLDAKARASISVRSPLGLVCDILERELGLASDRVFLWDQKVFSPNDFGMYIALQVVTCRPFSNIRTTVPLLGGGLQQVQSTNFWAQLSIDVISRGTEALERKEEVVMALKSFYSEQQQAFNSFYVAPLPNAIVNLSQIDGAAIPYRFNFSAAIQYQVSKISDIDYYDTFDVPEVFVDA